MFDVEPDKLRAAQRAGKAEQEERALLETSMVLPGRTGAATSWADLDALIARAAMQVVAQDAGLVDDAREAFLRYGKGRHPASLNLGDCASYVIAKA